MTRSPASRHDVIVVGAGHAGCEAALAAGRLQAATLLITPNLDAIAAMPCNCSIGGPAKAQLVREIDALGGEMARNIDRSFTHIRVLNASRGPAVRALRAQADKARYRTCMKSVLEQQAGLAVRQDTVVDLVLERDGICGVIGASGARYEAQAVVLCVGTFLNGVVHIGEAQIPAGRAGEPPASHLTEVLRRMGLPLRRFKTGTVPRVLLASLDLSQVTVQPSDSRPWRFAFAQVPRPDLPLLPCYVTATTPDTHALLRENSSRSALWAGRITGTGPRYCPSIEAKLSRFPDRQAHLVFLEQEGWDTQEVYVQGLSNSMPADVQLAMLRTVPGLANCEMCRPGYAIEYDCLDSRCLDPTLCLSGIRGLYFAGQICGTSGYEEAAGQGLVAGINAARFAQGREPLVLGRADGYLGVMIDDLTTRGLDEPYRLLTSRAEQRLAFGQDTGWFRLLRLAESIGLAPASQLADLRRMADSMEPRVEGSWDPQASGLRETPHRVLVRYREAQAISVSYGRRERARARRLTRAMGLPIPPRLRYESLPLSNEAKERLGVARPRTLGEAAALTGITAADIAVLEAVLAAKPERAGAK